ncbi:PAS domain S-box-containing protein [Pseudomonas lutea]|uniref:histidine kinase n=2 Tax=Pseudomonas TaxID=286 RepID=A0A9X8QJK4_9PSED|nr:PAS domain S-box-containing protein [Pseudomonas lutea]
MTRSRHKTVKYRPFMAGLLSTSWIMNCTLEVSSPDPAPMPSLSSDVLNDMVFELLPAAAFVCDATGAIVRYNRKAAEFWGRELVPGETYYIGIDRIFHVDGRVMQPEESPMASVLRTGAPVRNHELRVQSLVGQERWALINISPIFDEIGQIKGAINCFQDITERKESERKLQESQAFLQAIVDATPECIKIVTEDGSLMQMNGAGLAMIEADCLEAVQGSCVFDLIVPEHREIWIANHLRVCNGEQLSWTYDIIGLAGSRVNMETHAVPLRLPDGRRVHLAVTHNITQRIKDEQAVRESERHLSELLDGLAVAVYTTDAKGYLTFYNEAAVELWGYRPRLGKAQWCGSWKMQWPDGSELNHDECFMAEVLSDGKAIQGGEGFILRQDGSRVPFAAYPSPLRNAQGEITGAVNMCVDISRHKKAEAQQRELINELNDRVKNTLMTVQSIATYSLRSANAESRFRETFDARLLALSKAHDLLTHEQWQGAQLRAVIEQEIAPYTEQEKSDRIALFGSDYALEPREALALAMVFHELITNAAKYGALSVPEGRLQLEWYVGKDEHTGHDCLELSWLERDGPTVETPQTKGFGSRLIDRSITRELKGRVVTTFVPQGLECHLSIPLLCLQVRPKGSFV